MSHAQQRLWFLHQLDPLDPAYNIPIAVEFNGSLDPGALRCAVFAVTRRHEVLRATFRSVQGRPAQSATRGPTPHEPIPVAMADLSWLSSQAASQLAGESLRAAAAEPFQLADGQPARWALLRLARDRHILLLVVHHIVFDGGSLPVLAAELEACYLAARGGRPAGFAPLPLRYTEFARMQRAQHDQGAGEAGLRYWREQLAGAPGRLSVLTPGVVTGGAGGGTAGAGLAGAGPAGAGLAGAGPVCARLGLDRTAVGSLTSLARRHRCTPHIVFLTVLAVALARISGDTDVVLGVPVGIRDEPGSGALIGLFVNLLPLRARLAGDPAFSEALRRVRSAALDAFDHRAVPFERLVQELGPTRDAVTSPFFQVLVTYQRMPPLPRLPGVTARLIDVPPAAAKYELSITVTEAQDTADVLLEAAPGACDAVALGGLARALGVLIDAAAAAPEARLSRLPLVAGAERRRLAAAPPGRGAAPAEPESTVSALVAEQAAATPDAIALVDGDLHLTYRALDARAAHVAAALRERGAGPERVVAVHLPRRADLVVALLAVLKSGAAYLPLDPGHPPARVLAMLADAGAVALLTDRSYAPPPGCDTAVVRIDHVAARPVTRPHRAAPANLCYVLYTSGSTGRPKGVAIEHRSAAAFLRWAGTAFSAGELSNVAACTPVTFDLSVFELFAPLVHGGTVIMATALGDLQTAPAGNRVSLINTVPSVLETFLRVARLPVSVRAVNLAGEPLPADLAERLLRDYPQVTVRNLYGPSEATTYATQARVTARGGPSIGRAVATARTVITDRGLEPVPAGFAGELLIGGIALARGYLNQPARTAERFVPDGLSGIPGVRLYRSGDLCRWLPDGELAFLGRLDRQVKLRGVRIEPEEIEAVLRRHPAVAAAAVVVSGADPRRQRLIAHVVPAGPAPPGQDEILAQLRAELPAAMVPAAIVVRDRLPWTATGKLDRGALAAHHQPHHLTQPRTELERTIAGIWSTTLGRPDIGADEGFFDAGGNSLLLLELHARLREAVDPSLTVADLFHGATVAAQAQLIAARPDAAAALATSARRGAARRAAQTAGQRRAGR
ncbi:MAG TPA: amino acid adenylation domain-containing protein [Streptosporangiaceae bacterium]|nr:amino acid adenylation domain-containing protein [Streptosporangiaceae bacterium]